MAALGITAEQAIQIKDTSFVFSEITYNTSGDTVSVDTGTMSAAVLYGSGDGTAPSVTITAGATGDTILLSGGTTGVKAWLVTRSSGNPASRGAGSQA